MSTPSTLAGMFAGAILAVSTAGFGFAAPAGPTTVPVSPTAGPSTPSQPTTPAQATTPAQPSSPAAVFVSSPSAQPGTTVHVSGTCALPPSGALPTVVSVNSPAFTGPEKFSKTDPDAFDGTATIARTAAPGHYIVALTCSNSTATTELRVIGPDRPAGGSGHAAAAPAVPAVPAAPVVPAVAPAVHTQDGPSDEPWLGVGIGLLTIGAAGATAFVVGRSQKRVRG
jgi:hypothetical protein